ncbi:MAG: hypothetical protein ABL959_08595 [Pyrinomonadaceae bacterium]
MRCCHELEISTTATPEEPAFAAEDGCVPGIKFRFFEKIDRIFAIIVSNTVLNSSFELPAVS